SDNGKALKFNPPAPVLAADEGHVVGPLRQAGLKVLGERLAVSAWIDELLLLAGKNGKLGCPDMNKGEGRCHWNRRSIKRLTAYEFSGNTRATARVLSAATRGWA